jgi:hypothetical protein
MKKDSPIMLELQDTRTTEEPRMVHYQPPMDWQQWNDWLAAELHGRSRWRLSLIIMGIGCWLDSASFLL